MNELAVWGAIVVAGLTVVWLLGKKMDGVFDHGSQGLFLRDLNKGMEKYLVGKLPAAEKAGA